MKQFNPVVLVLGLVLSACSSAKIFTTPTVSPTQPQPTSAPKATYTPSPIPTQTLIPTPIGGSQPMVAFVGKDSQGNYGLYIDGFYTRKPKKIAPVPELVNTSGFPYTDLEMKWSSDGKKLIFVNGELGERSFFLFDTVTAEVQELVRVPNRQSAYNLIWSQDGKEIFFYTTSQSNPRARNWKLELSSGKFTEINEYPGINSYFHISSPINCDTSSFPTPIKELQGSSEFSYHSSICFYPELNAYSGIRTSQESSDLVLLSPTGVVDKILVRFPAGFGTNGQVGLSLSPDKSEILIIGDGGIEVSGHPFAYLAPFASLPLDKSDPKLFPKDYDPSQEMQVHVFGWSPDSQNYLVASGNEGDYKLAIIQASSGNILYEYRIPNEIEPAILIYQSARGVEMTWPSEP